jgi:hypothetical protein
MENNQTRPFLKAVVQQVTNNTTSWIGHRTGETHALVSGQTFICPTEGELDSIEVISTHVGHAEPVDLTLHHFDPETKTWGPVLKTARVEFNSKDTGKWISFPLHGLQLQKGSSYGFRLKSEGGLIGVGEAVGSYDHLPSNTGQEWISNTGDQQGKYFSYVSLAFKIELRA